MIDTPWSQVVGRLEADKAALKEDLEALKMATGMDFLPHRTKARHIIIYTFIVNY